MKKTMLVALFVVANLMAFAADWGFAGGRMYFDNRVTQWSGVNIYLIIGKSDYSSVYEMAPDIDSVGWYTCALPSSGWGDAEYMAVIGNSAWNKGNFGYETLKGAKYYTAAYTAGLSNTAQGKGFVFTPQSAGNGCTIHLKWLGDSGYDITFSSADKNRCYKLDDVRQEITLILSTSTKRFNISRSDVRTIYAYGSITAWVDNDEDYHLNGYSDDGCFYRVFPYSAMERPGNSGQPEFLFNVHKSDDTWDKVKASKSWEGYDSRYMFENNGQNMIIVWNSDDLNEIAERAEIARYVRPLSSFNLTDSADQHKISNFRRVPGTVHLYRSYHPYKPDRSGYDTEYQRLLHVAKLATEADIKCDIALSGNQTSAVGSTYECGGKNYTIAIPDYYQTIIANNRVLYVGTANGKTPDFNTVIYHSDGELFGQWFKEIVEFIIDDTHPAPFQIHCSLGADRTGMFCGTLAALCGADWESIATDYESTRNLQINEFRHRNVLRYCLRHMTGVDPETAANLKDVIADHFVEGGYLTQDQINTAVAKLKQQQTTPVKSVMYDDVEEQLYDLLGRPVCGTPQPGIYITNNGKKIVVER